MKRIAIDVGHARGTGARGYVDEHDTCAALAEEVKHALESFKVDTFQADIIDFPDKTNGGDLSATVKAINDGNYDLCVSLHMDASDNASAHGAHVCYYSTNGKRLAEEIALRLCAYLPGRAEETQKRTDLYVLKNTKPVAVLVECGFCTNKEDVAVVKKDPFYIARAIALGIAAYFPTA